MAARQEPDRPTAKSLVKAMGAVISPNEPDPLLPLDDEEHKRFFIPLYDGDCELLYDIDDYTITFHTIRIPETAQGQGVGKKLAQVLTECLNVRINVLGTVCDMSAVNTKALKILGAKQEYPFFTHQAKELVTIADPPHLLKCTRNMLQSHDIECDVDIRSDQKGVRGIAKWSHIGSFYDLDNSNPNFVYAPALLEKHLNPNSKQKMRVKLAAHVFSHSVTAGTLSKVTTDGAANMELRLIQETNQSQLHVSSSITNLEN